MTGSSSAPSEAGLNDRTLEAPSFPVEDVLRGMEQVRRALEEKAETARAFGLHRPGAAELPTIPGYQVVRELGRGGMGVVYQAWQASLNRTVALKMLRTGDYAVPEELARFRTEAEALGRLEHPHIVRVYETGEHAGRPYLVMEFVDGCSLAQHLAGAPLPPRPAAELVQHLSEAIHYAHQRGIIHRDLKPGNILLQESGVRSQESGVRAERNPAGFADSCLLTPDSCPKISDFGLARILVGGETVHTQTGAVLGTPSYMAPEQAGKAGKEVGPAADVYALGAILYELLTGRPPFRAATPLETLLQVQTEEPVPASRLQPKLPRDLVTICHKCLEKEPHKRYASARALGEDLQHYLAGRPVAARPVSAAGRAWRWCRRNPLVASLLTLAVLLLVLIATGSALSALWLRQERDAAVRAEQKAERRLYETYLAQAQARRQSGRAGQRLQALAALAEVARLRPRLQLSPEQVLALRNEAIACMALPDLRRDEAQAPDYPPALGDGEVAFDADLEHYARIDDQGMIVVRRLEGDREVQRLAGCGRSEQIPYLRFSPDGRWLAAKYAQGQALYVQVWDRKSGQVLFKKRGGGQWFYLDLDFRPDGKMLAFSRLDGSIGLYDLPSGQESQRLPCPSAPAVLRFHPRGDRLAIGQGNIVRILNLKDGQETQRLAHPAPVPALAWSGDGRLLACAGFGQRTAHVWDVSTGRLQGMLHGHPFPVTHLAFHPASNLLATSCWDGMTRLWNPRTCALLVADEGGRSFGSAALFSRDGRWLGRTGAGVSRWEVITSAECRTLASRGPTQVLRGTDFSPDGRLLAVAGADGVRLWDVERGQEAALVTDAPGHAVLFHPSGTSLLTCTYSELLRWPVQPGKPGRAEVLRIGPPHLLARASAGRLGRISTDRDGTVVGFVDGDGSILGHTRTVAWEAGGKTSKFVGLHRAAVFVAVSPNGRWLTSGSYNGHDVKVWETATRKLVKEFPGRTAQVAFSPDGKWLVVSTNGDYHFYQTGSWELRHKRSCGRGTHGPAAFSRDGKLLAVIQNPNNLIKLLDPRTRQELATLHPSPPATINGLSFNVDGSRLAAATETEGVQLWDLQRIRRRLASMDLDWDPESLPPAEPPGEARPVRVRVELGKAPTD
jgi:WD40 repeat protein